MIYRSDFRNKRHHSGVASKRGISLGSIRGLRASAGEAAVCVMALVPSTRGIESSAESIDNVLRSYVILGKTSAVVIFCTFGSRKSGVSLHTAGDCERWGFWAVPVACSEENGLRKIFLTRLAWYAILDRFSHGGCTKTGSYAGGSTLLAVTKMIFWRNGFSAATAECTCAVQVHSVTVF